MFDPEGASARVGARAGNARGTPVSAEKRSRRHEKCAGRHLFSLRRIGANQTVVPGFRYEISRTVGKKLHPERGTRQQRASPIPLPSHRLRDRRSGLRAAGPRRLDARPRREVPARPEPQRRVPRERGAAPPALRERVSPTLRPRVRRRVAIHIGRR